MSEANVPRMLLSAPASNAGKTTVTCALLRALQRRGMDVRACKCGPDYIDPLFHERVIGVPSRNLDLFFADGSFARRLLARNAQERGSAPIITLLEGAMGYYDGIGVSDEASAWDTARVTETPAVLVVDARGRALSIAAEVAGYVRFRDPGMVRGIILNRLSPMLFDRIKQAVEAETGVPVLGYVPSMPDCAFESRHLGLVGADEVANLQAKVDALADAVEQSVDLDALVELARTAPPIEFACEDVSRETYCSQTQYVAPLAARPASIPPSRPASTVEVPEEEPDEMPVASTTGEAAAELSVAPAVAPAVSPAIAPSAAPAITAPSLASAATASPLALAAAETPAVPCIAVARDAAFCFYYADTLDLLERLGARLVPFSPLADEALPDGTCGLYLGGGYPELHARQLAENESMRRSVRQAVRAGMPTIAECGGFLYLHAYLRDEHGQSHPMAGVFDAEAFPAGKLGRFGYVTLEAHEDSMLVPRGGTLRAHEFHYWESSCPGESFTARKPRSARSWTCVHATETLYAGFPHLYLAGNPQAARRFVKACSDFSQRSAASPERSAIAPQQSATTSQDSAVNRQHPIIAPQRSSAARQESAGARRHENVSRETFDASPKPPAEGGC